MRGSGGRAGDATGLYRPADEQQTQDQTEHSFFLMRHRIHRTSLAVARGRRNFRFPARPDSLRLFPVGLDENVPPALRKNDAPGALHTVFKRVRSKEKRAVCVCFPRRPLSALGRCLLHTIERVNRNGEPRQVEAAVAT